MTTSLYTRLIHEVSIIFIAQVVCISGNCNDWGKKEPARPRVFSHSSWQDDMAEDPIGALLGGVPVNTHVYLENKLRKPLESVRLL